MQAADDGQFGETGATRDSTQPCCGAGCGDHCGGTANPGFQRPFSARLRDRDPSASAAFWASGSKILLRSSTGQPASHLLVFQPSRRGFLDGPLGVLRRRSQGAHGQGACSQAAPPTLHQAHEPNQGETLHSLHVTANCQRCICAGAQSAGPAGAGWLSLAPPGRSSGQGQARFLAREDQPDWEAATESTNPGKSWLTRSLPARPTVNSTRRAAADSQAPTTTVRLQCIMQPSVLGIELVFGISPRSDPLGSNLTIPNPY